VRRQGVRRRGRVLPLEVRPRGTDQNPRARARSLGDPRLQHSPRHRDPHCDVRVGLRRRGAELVGRPSRDRPRLHPSGHYGRQRDLGRTVRRVAGCARGRSRRRGGLSVSRFGFVGGRTLQAIPVILGVTIISFFVLRLIPGDPTTVMLGTHWTPARAAQLRENLGLNKPIWDQYYLFMDHLAHGNLSAAVYCPSPVARLIGQRLPVTLWLAAYATVIAVLISVPLATISALRKNGVVDQSVRATFLVTFAMPPFWVGLILILLL